MARVLDISFSTFVYPFSFEDREFHRLVSNVEKAEFGAEKAQKFWIDAKFPHQELLPHIANYLSSKNGKEATARRWKLNDAALTSYDGLGAHADWSLIFKRKDATAPEKASGDRFEIPFCFTEVQLFLFQAGIGLLAITVKPQTDSLEKWQDFTAHFRKFYSADLTAVRKKDKDREHTENFFPTFTSDGKNSGKGNIRTIVKGLLNKIDSGEWWRNVFIERQFLPYTALFVTDHPPQNDYQLLYKLRNFFHTKQGDHPAPTDLLADHSSLLEYSERQWFTFALNGGNFLACDPPDTTFFRTTLPAHIRDQYFHLYIIALHQRFSLMDMSHNVAEHWWTKDEEERMLEFEHLRDRFLSFTARGYFAQVMQREHHHRNYRKWQDTFELQRLYDEVREEVREMFDWLQLKISQESAERSARFERRIGVFALLFTICIGIPSLVVGFFGMNISDMPQTIDLNFKNALLIIGATLTICILLGSALYFYMGSPQKSKRKDGE